MMQHQWRQALTLLEATNAPIPAALYVELGKAAHDAEGWVATIDRDLEGVWRMRLTETEDDYGYIAHVEYSDGLGNFVPAVEVRVWLHSRGRYGDVEVKLTEGSEWIWAEEGVGGDWTERVESDLALAAYNWFRYDELGKAWLARHKERNK